MLRVTEAQHLEGYKLRLAFSDGCGGVVDLSGKLTGPVFAPLREAEVFASFTPTDHTVQWDCGADFAPEYLRDLLEPAAFRRDTNAAAP